jgi:predicted amidophosphoribosyltransferase
MAKYCQHCGKEINEESRKDACEECREDQVATFYTYSHLRFEIWQFLKTHGAEKTRTMVFNKMIEEEGMEWVVNALGKELVDEITQLPES